MMAHAPSCPLWYSRPTKEQLSCWAVVDFALSKEAGAWRGADGRKEIKEGWPSWSAVSATSQRSHMSALRRCNACPISFIAPTLHQLDSITCPLFA